MRVRPAQSRKSFVSIGDRYVASKLEVISGKGSLVRRPTTAKYPVPGAVNISHIAL